MKLRESRQNIDAAIPELEQLVLVVSGDWFAGLQAQVFSAAYFFEIGSTIQSRMSQLVKICTDALSNLPDGSPEDDQRRMRFAAACHFVAQEGFLYAEGYGLEEGSHFHRPDAQAWRIWADEHRPHKSDLWKFRRSHQD